MGSLGVSPCENTKFPGEDAAASASRRPAVALAALLVIATAALYLRVHRYDFVNYDDTLYVTQNAHVQEGLTWDTVRWAFTTYHVGTWHPVTWLSHALDCQIFDVDPAGPHDINLLLHLSNALLLFWVLQRATGFTGRSFVVAALFALHPINVESVVWIAERKNSLSLLFFLLALGAYRWYVERPKAGRYLVVFALFALGLMAKPQVITLPFVLLLWDYWPLQRIAIRSSPFAVRQRDKLAAPKESTNTCAHELSGGERRAKSEERSLLLEKFPLFALAGASAAITMAAQRADGNKVWYPLALRIEYAIVSYVQYLGKALWPVHLSPFYPHPDSVNFLQVSGAALLLAAITFFVIAAHRSRPYLLVGWFFFLGTLVPMLGLEGVGYQGKQGIADRYAYLPFIGLFVMISWGLGELAEQKHIPLVVQRGVSIGLLAGLWLISYRQLGHWRDNLTLWSHALSVTQGNFLAENNLGRALVQQGRLAEGAAHFYKAAEIYPDDPVSNFNIGIYEQKQGNYTAAIERFQKTLSVTRDPELRAAASKSLSAAYSQTGSVPQ